LLFKTVFACKSTNQNSSKRRAGLRVCGALGHSGRYTTVSVPFVKKPVGGRRWASTEGARIGAPSNERQRRESRLAPSAPREWGVGRGIPLPSPAD